MISEGSYQLIVVGSSYGGVQSLRMLLPSLSEKISIPIVLVQHIKPSKQNLLAEQLDDICCHHVKEAQDHESICDKVIYFAPGGYHLLVESDRTLTLSRDDPVEFSRPSIDVLFESAADAYESTLIGVLLTGANHDGAEGIASIYDQGGVTIAEDPDTAVMATMPQSAIDTGKVHQILPLDRMANYISSIVNQPNGSAGEE